MFKEGQLVKVIKTVKTISGFADLPVGTLGRLGRFQRKEGTYEIFQFYPLQYMSGTYAVVAGVHVDVFVSAAAISQDGKVWSVPAPGRHHDVVALMHQHGVKLTSALDDQGFLLSDGRFVGRAEAKQVAVRAGQYKDSTGHDLPELYSEDLW